MGLTGSPLLAPPGFPWLLLAPPGSPLAPLAPPGSCCWLSPGSSRLGLGSPRLAPRLSPGSSWFVLAPPGSSWPGFVSCSYSCCYTTAVFVSWFWSYTWTLSRSCSWTWSWSYSWSHSWATFVQRLKFAHAPHLIPLARRSQARRSQDEPGGARGPARHEAWPGGARMSQDEPGGARREPGGEPGGARRNQGEPGGARGEGLLKIWGL